MSLPLISCTVAICFLETVQSEPNAAPALQSVCRRATNRASMRVYEQMWQDWKARCHSIA
jgi:hypothetical protein